MDREARVASVSQGLTEYHNHVMKFCECVIDGDAWVTSVRLGSTISYRLL